MMVVMQLNSGRFHGGKGSVEAFNLQSCFESNFFIRVNRSTTGFKSKLSSLLSITLAFDGSD